MPVKNLPWRTVIIESSSRLSIQNGWMVLTSEEEEKQIPLEQVREVIVMSARTSVTIPLLTELANQNKSVIFCDSRKFPVCELTGINLHTDSAGRLMDQAAWTKRRKDAIWRQVVQMKLHNQIDLMRLMSLEIPETLQICSENVKYGDSTNREAVAAKIYFGHLFGDSFIRFASDGTNYALNYGYTILCSAFSRTIVLHGYNTAIGIHHCNRQNSYNLASDLMEPFRPFIDKIVYENKERRMDSEYRKELISVVHTECIYDGLSMDIATAIDRYVLDVMHCMEIPRGKLKEVHFA